MNEDITIEELIESLENEPYIELVNGKEKELQHRAHQIYGSISNSLSEKDIIKFVKWLPNSVYSQIEKVSETKYKEILDEWIDKFIIESVIEETERGLIWQNSPWLNQTI